MNKSSQAEGKWSFLELFVAFTDCGGNQGHDGMVYASSSGRRRHGERAAARGQERKIH